MAKHIIFVVLAVLSLLVVVKGHGRLKEPAGRSSIWRYQNTLDLSESDKELIEENYEDNELFCGGFSYQQALGGKCGICGDPYDADVKENEAGGRYANGIIVRHYEQPGAWVTAEVEITAHHKGYFEFRLCPWNQPDVSVAGCENWYLLDTVSPDGTKWFLPASTGQGQIYEVPIKLPDGVVCDQCVLQWRYHTGNSWGCYKNGGCCVGCGPQEEFYGCADVSIHGSGEPPATTEMKTTSTLMSAIMSTTTSTSASPTTTTTTSESTTTTSPGEPDEPICEHGGYTKRDCTSFYMCSNGIAYEFACPPGTVWDDDRSLCDHPYNVVSECGTRLQ
ncbi:uncharacterized protein LOC120339509 [Styela clava]